jgi:thiol-disulfide isomerase/thioredoxin
MEGSPMLPSYRLALVLVTVALSAACLPAQSVFSGRLDKALDVDPTGLSFAFFRPISLAEAQALGATADDNDKLFAGEFALPKDGDLRYKAVVVRKADGADILYVDTNRDGRFSETESFQFHPHVPPLDERLKSWVDLRVDLPPGLFSSCPMDVWIIKEGVPSPAPPGQLPVPYTSQPYVQGFARLPKHNLPVRLEYDFVSKGIALTTGIEWWDINGNGKFDQTPGSGETMRAHGAAPIFTVDELTLQLESVDLANGTFKLRHLTRSADHHIPLMVGTILPDFSFIDFSGAQHHLSEVKGRIVLLDFWATWCVHCMEEMPKLQKLYAELHNQGFNIVGFNGDQTPSKAEKTVQTMGIPWYQAKYDKAILEDRLQISQWPTVVLVDEHRKILSIGAANQLPLDIEHLPRTLRTLLGVQQ